VILSSNSYFQSRSKKKKDDRRGEGGMTNKTETAKRLAEYY
jgi:hypothetical protein